MPWNWPDALSIGLQGNRVTAWVWLASMVSDGDHWPTFVGEDSFDGSSKFLWKDDSPMLNSYFLVLVGWNLFFPGLSSATEADMFAHSPSTASMHAGAWLGYFSCLDFPKFGQSHCVIADLRRPSSTYSTVTMLICIGMCIEGGIDQLERALMQ